MGGGTRRPQVPGALLLPCKFHMQVPAGPLLHRVTFSGPLPVKYCHLLIELSSQKGWQEGDERWRRGGSGARMWLPEISVCCQAWHRRGCTRLAAAQPGLGSLPCPAALWPWELIMALAAARSSSDLGGHSLCLMSLLPGASLLSLQPAPVARAIHVVLTHLPACLPLATQHG